MYNNEKTLKNGSKAYQLVEQLKKVATSCLQSDLEAKEKVIIQLEDLGRIFKPYHDEFQRIKEEKKQHELEVKRICTEQGHSGEWEEETYYTEGWMGDLSDRQLVKQARVRWRRICTRCGEREISEKEPEEIKKLRKMQEIEAMEEKIKRMKAEL